MSGLVPDSMPEVSVFIDPYSGGAKPDLESKSKKGPWQKFVSFIWDADFYDKSDAERRLVFKLDCFLLPALTLGWWVKNLDQSNLSRAYVSGMKEDLNILGNEYTYMTTIYAAVLAGMQLPSNFIVMKVRPALFLGLAEIGWTIFTFAQAGARSYQAMYGFRFCIAFFESAYYPVAYFLLVTDRKDWYTRPKLAKRVALWYIAQSAGSALSGFLQAGIYESMDGLSGLAGWRWLYVICGVIISLIPPALGICRRRNGRTDAVTGKIDKASIIATIKTWKFWLLVPWFTVYALSGLPKGQSGVYLKAFNYSLWRLFPDAVLAFWGTSNHLRVSAFLISGTTDVTPLFFAWVSDICRGNTVQRAFIVGSITAFWYATDAWIEPIIYRQTDSPRFKIGFQTSFYLNIVSVVMLVAMSILQLRDTRAERRRELEKQREVASDLVEEESEAKV
ncbi:hypothetical protein TREMEDRAFT_64396 [Tremella mesenterica DSM 1558]|uniref:uncharacterized protein n=1 Tax=Tremella mesenterica (strain ATCC 24925 / CBS 8224 / DSM 1558 / NBRC 9311 / NRRL Y-6157 / RJB 2259-6 / UBC 559-6) TaxID=578456 RepID=UPI0003F4A427|nr:uncharacterized protein TREMEDRAFT_64396 [Tremella mesenterica DSM 1558]EIW67156.1 hypothetical protein TREMEDRAFT_64396 [Tremella mesenterica DSM 1558]